PEPKGEEVLLRVEAAGVCHSDVHIWDGYFDLGGEQRISLESRGVRLPFTMGHEIAGEVAALGAQASGVNVGDKVVAYPWIGCGEGAVCRKWRGTALPQPAHPRHATRRRLWHASHCATRPLPSSASGRAARARRDLHLLRYHCFFGAQEDAWAFG